MDAYMAWMTGTARLPLLHATVWL